MQLNDLSKTLAIVEFLNNNQVLGGQNYSYMQEGHYRIKSSNEEGDWLVDVIEILVVLVTDLLERVKQLEQLHNGTETELLLHNIELRVQGIQELVKTNEQRLDEIVKGK